VAGLLLQIMEEGVLTDSTGRRVSFRNAIVVMTSNVGGEITGDGLGFNPASRADKTEKALRQVFTPEFLGRLDEIVVFRALEQATMTGIARKYLGQLTDRLGKMGIVLSFPEELAGELSADCGGRGGARQIRSLIQNRVEGPLASYLLECGGKPEKVEAFRDRDRICFR